MDRDRLAHRQPLRGRRRRALPCRSYRLEGRLPVHGGPDAGWDRGDAVSRPEPPSDMEPHKPPVPRPGRDDLGAESTSFSSGSARWRSRSCFSSRASGCLATSRARWRCRSSEHQGFTNTTDIATVTKVFGFWIALGGTLVGGVARAAHRHDGEPPHRHGGGLRPRISRSRSLRRMAGMAARRSGPSRWRSASRALLTPSPRSCSSPPHVRRSHQWSMRRASSAC